MLSGLLNSDVAISANIAIMRAFVQVREYLMTATSVSAELKELRAKVDLLAISGAQRVEKSTGLQQNAILRILSGDLWAIWAQSGHFGGEVATQKAP